MPFWGNYPPLSTIMKSIIKGNRTYFILLTLFAVFGGILTCIIQKPEGILFFSEHRSPAANFFFRYATKLGEAPMYFVFGIFLLGRKIRHAVLLGLTGLVVMGVSAGLKTFFAIDRPIRFLQNYGLAETIEYVEGVALHSAATSFPSGHTMSAFALYSVLIFILPKKTWISILLFSTAVIVGLSRVYLVQHFWDDVYAGALIGMFLAILMYAVDQGMEGKLEGRLFQSRQK